MNHKHRSPLLFTGLSALFLLAIAFLPTVGVFAETDQTGRDTTYPAPVASISHSPEDVPRDGTFQVTLHLRPDAEEPERVSLIWCRVEPDYVCAMPEIMQPQGDGVWSVTVPGQFPSVIHDETRHVGYNLSLYYPSTQDGEPDARIFAPTHNTWIPDTFPEDTDGKYYFIELGEPTKSAPGAPFVAALVLLSLGMMGLGRQKRPGGPHHG